MRVKIGPYLTWYGPYQIADLLFGNPPRHYEDQPKGLRRRCADWLGDKLAETKLADICSWIHSKRKRKEVVKLDYYDHYNADHTLALIILPVLKQLRASKHGSGYIDDCDVPEHLRSTAAPHQEATGASDLNLHRRYEWFLDEVIWAFEQHCDTDEEDKFFFKTEKHSNPTSLQEQIDNLEVDHEALTAHYKRKQHAFSMFGKYFATLWD